MKVIRQYKVIFPFNYDRIIHNIKNINAKRQEIGHRQMERCSFKKNVVSFVKVNVSKHHEYEASYQLLVLLLVIYTLIQNIYNDI